MKTIGNKEMNEKAVVLMFVMIMLVSGIIYREDFSGQIWAALIWFGVLILAMARLIIFFITKR